MAYKSGYSSGIYGDPFLQTDSSHHPAAVATTVASYSSSTSGYSSSYTSSDRHTKLESPDQRGREPSEGPLKKLTVDLIKTYRTINEVGCNIII